MIPQAITSVMAMTWPRMRASSRNTLRFRMVMAVYQVNSSGRFFVGLA